MGTKVKETCTVISQECIGKDIYSMWLQTKTIAGNAKPGQFVSVYTQDGGKLLPRPISLCEIDKEKGSTASCLPRYRQTYRYRRIFQTWRRRTAGSSRTSWKRLSVRGSRRQKSIPYGRRHRCTAYA